MCGRASEGMKQLPTTPAGDFPSFPLVGHLANKIRGNVPLAFLFHLDDGLQCESGIRRILQKEGVPGDETVNLTPPREPSKRLW